MTEKEKIQIFYACDDNFVKYTIVSIQSLKENASKDFDYHIHILFTKMTEEMKKATLLLADEKFQISFDDVTDFLKGIDYKLHRKTLGSCAKTTILSTVSRADNHQIQEQHSRILRQNHSGRK